MKNVQERKQLGSKLVGHEIKSDPVITGRVLKFQFVIIISVLIGERLLPIPRPLRTLKVFNVPDKIREK
jgi:hypothetical protein